MSCTLFAEEQRSERGSSSGSRSRQADRNAVTDPPLAIHIHTVNRVSIRTKHLASWAGVLLMSDPASHAATADPSPEGEKAGKVRPYSVILCRGESPESASDAATGDEFASLFRVKGFSDVRSVPLLRFHFINQQVLERELDRDAAYSGLILTSPRAVDAVANIMTASQAVRWREKQNFTLGPRTSARAFASGLTRRLHQEVAGNSRILALSIVKQLQEQDGGSWRFLMPCSSLARDELPMILRQHHVHVETIAAYETQGAPDAWDRLRSAVTEAAFDDVLLVFFSPSGVNSVADRLSPCFGDKKLSFVTIGPTTAAALESLELPVLCVASLPSAQTLAREVEAAVTAAADLCPGSLAEQVAWSPQAGVLVEQEDAHRDG